MVASTLSTTDACALARHYQERFLRCAMRQLDAVFDAFEAAAADPDQEARLRAFDVQLYARVMRMLKEREEQESASNSAQPQPQPNSPSRAVERAPVRVAGKRVARRDEPGAGPDTTVDAVLQTINLDASLPAATRAAAGEGPVAQVPALMNRSARRKLEADRRRQAKKSRKLKT